MKVNVLCGFQSANGFTSLQHIVTTYRAVYENEQKKNKNLLIVLHYSAISRGKEWRQST